MKGYRLDQQTCRDTALPPISLSPRPGLAKAVKMIDRSNDQPTKRRGRKAVYGITGRGDVRSVTPGFLLLAREMQHRNRDTNRHSSPSYQLSMQGCGRFSIKLISMQAPRRAMRPEVETPSIASRQLAKPPFSLGASCKN